MDANAFWDLLQQCLNFGNDLQIEGVSPVIKNGIHTIFLVLKPTASMILALFTMSEIYRIYMKTEQLMMPGSMVMLYAVSWTLFKVAIAIFLIRHMEEILWAVYDLSASVMSVTQSVQIGTSGVPGGITKEQIDELFREADGNIISNVLFSFQLLIVRLGLSVAMVYINIILWSRNIEIYLLAALSAFPMVSFVSEEYSAIGKSFLKHFTAVCLRGAVMIVVIKLYNVMVIAIPLDGSDLLSLGISMLQCLAVLCVALSISGRLAKTLTGAM